MSEADALTQKKLEAHRMVISSTPHHNDGPEMERLMAILFPHPRPQAANYGVYNLQGTLLDDGHATEAGAKLAALKLRRENNVPMVIKLVTRS